MSGAGPHAWERLWGWELLLAATLLVPAGTVLLDGRLTQSEVLAAATLLAILPLYFLLGRRKIRCGDARGGVVYIALLTLLYWPSVFLLPDTTFALFGLASQCFLALPARRAIVAVVILCTAPAIGIVLSKEPPGAIIDLIVLVTIVVFFSSAMGFWIERITAQSRERADLIEQLESTRAEVTRLSAERGAQEERERLAGEIHDTLAQGFTSIIMLAQAAQTAQDPAKHLALAVQTAKENLAEARALISALTPAPLDSSTLVEAMRRLAARTGEELEVRVEVEVRGAARPLPTQTDVVLIRALQEGLANVRKHASAGSVQIRLEYGEQDVKLSVVDDGVGFACANGFGLSTMRGRVEQAGGSLDVRSAPGQGTTLAVEVPA